jgi:Family of unknown function (DUF6491)
MEARSSGASAAEVNMRGFALISAGLLLGLAGAAASAQPADQTPAPPAQTVRSCFFVNEFDSWRAPDANTIFIRTNVSRYFRLDLAQACPSLLWPDTHLIMNVRGPNTICSAVDWDLKVSSGIHGIPVGCIVKTMSPMTADEVAAIPKKFKP